MAGIKISELNRWSLNEISGIDASDILIPVSINKNTGALLASVLLQMLEKHAPEYYMRALEERVRALEGNLTTLQENISTLEDKNSSLTAEIEQLKRNQTEIDETQTAAISQNIASISDINVVNASQTADIDRLKAMHDWENYNDEDPGSTTDEQNNQLNP